MQKLFTFPIYNTNRVGIQYIYNEKRYTLPLFTESESFMTTVQHNTKVATEQPKAETPKVAASTSTPAVAKTPVGDRIYALIAPPSITPKGKQRQIVLAAFGGKLNQPMRTEDIVAYATKAGLTANAGAEASTKWHLHQMFKLGILKVVNPTVEKAEKAA